MGDDHDLERRALEVLERLIDRTAGARDRLLEPLCQGDRRLIARVRELLAADDARLSVHSDEHALPTGCVEEEGGTAGPYRLVSLLGEGGMGRVWLAQRADEEFEQEVALKLIRAGISTSGLEQRFRRERQMLARLHHDGIARLLDGGSTPDGRPYLVMELVDGVPIDRHCSSRSLDLAERLSLVASVCDAVDAAHELGIVHRDLKPTNILVTPDSRPKLLDFGIAKALEDETGPDATLLTRTGERVLTPRYATPEQIREEPVTTATDVYALGVVMYELVTGQSPYGDAAHTLHDLETAILHEAPAAPSRAHSRDRTGATSAWRLRGDVDVITLRALAKDPARRYRRAGDLAADIRRHLAREPIAARRDSPSYRIATFVRRHRALVVATALVFVALAIGLAISLIQYADAVRQRELTLAVNRFFTDEILRGADPGRALEAEITMREVLDRAATTIEDRFVDEPLIEAAVRVAIGATYKELGHNAAGVPHLRRAYELRREFLGDDHQDTFEAGRDLASALSQPETIDEGIALGERLWRRRRETRGADLAALVVGGNLATAYGIAQRHEDAETLHREILSIRENTVGEHHEATASTLNNLAVTLSRLNRLDEAIEMLERSVRIRDDILGPDHPKTSTARGNLAYQLFVTGKVAQAAEVFEQVLATQERVDGRLHPRTLTTLNNLGMCRSRVGDWPGAARAFRTALERAEEHGELPAEVQAFREKAEWAESQ